MDHLDRFLDYPTHCPHGGVIPSADGRYEEDSHTVLADIADGQSVVVERFIDNHDLLTYLDDLKLKIGEELTIIEHTPFEGPVKIRLHKTEQEINVSFKAAHYIFVK
jgi:DtxR family Mn-dependent transcriptional regulator